MCVTLATKKLGTRFPKLILPAVWPGINKALTVGGRLELLGSLGPSSRIRVVCIFSSVFKDQGTLSM